MNRRRFLSQSAAASVAAMAASSWVQPRAQAKNLANGKIVVCCTGVRGRGNSLLHSFGEQPDVEVKYICDIDPSVMASRAGAFESKFGIKPERISEYRKALDDKSLDALVLGTPDHWHALPTIHGCQAGKDVYTEKPDGNNLEEGRVMAAAAKKYGRVVQLGTQARSDPDLHAVIEYVKQGHLGKVVQARAWESATQPNLGKPADGNPPEGVDYDVWLGPAPKRPFNPLRYHGNWRWFFDYGAGDLGNDGVHRLDTARQLLEAAMEAEGAPPLGLPKAVSAHGGKLYFDDAQEWPDTQLVTYDYGTRILSYDLRIWSPYNIEDEPEGAAIYGDKGLLVVGGKKWRHYGPKRVLVAEGARGDKAQNAHIRNFLECMASRGKPNADLDTVGRPSSLLCHLGNIAWRVGRTVKFDEKTYDFGSDAEANRFRTREEYRKPYTLPSVNDV
jgi:predicted dehydrogenase